MHWICSILLDVRISSSLCTDGDRFNLTEGPTYAFFDWKILSFECSFCNICWVSVVATSVNGKAGHMSHAHLLLVQRGQKNRRANRCPLARFHWV